AMVLHFEDATGMGRLVLLVVAAGEVSRAEDRAALEASLRTSLRTELSPRHVPDHVVFVDSIPRTSTGKRLEIPLKRIVQGAARDQVLDPGVVLLPEQLDETVRRVREVLGDAVIRTA
ncbi:MAG TPA: acetoacetate--CoA ligase, partial [Citricoccus sp.]